MVRFQWHVEEGFGAIIPPNGMRYHPGTAVQHVSCEIEIPGESQPVHAIFTVPAGYMTDGKVRNIGVVLGHGENAEEWNGTLLTELAVKLAQAGHVVVRYHSSGKELRRQRTYEKALDVCATSPFARFVQRWVMGGIGHGARLAAIVGPRARATVCGYIFLSYPLTDPLPTAKGPVLPDSSILLLRISAPALFIHGAKNTKIPTSQVKTVAAQMKPAADVRLAEIADADSGFASGEPPEVQPSTVNAISQPMLEFLGALQSSKMTECKVPHAIPPGQPPVVLSESAAQGIAAQIAVLDEDDSLIYEVEPYGNAPSGNGIPAVAAAAAADAVGVNGQQQVAQQMLQQQAAAQLQLQQAQLAAVMAAKSGMPLQAAAAQRAGGVTAGGAASSGLVGPVVVPAGIALTPQMLAAAQAMAAAQQAAANQGVRPAVATAAAPAAQQQ